MKDNPTETVTMSVLELEIRMTSAKLEELKHIDDPINVNLYFSGLIPVKDRIIELEASLKELAG